jgi:uncharacterized protein YqjF (DUF2071 family)
MQQIWNHLLFAHWAVPTEVLRPLIPAALTLDSFGGQGWVAVTPFHMTGVRLRWTPPIPGLSSFPELNVRTYVRLEDKAGVYFFSLDAGTRLAAWSARLSYRLPYFYARMAVEHDQGWIRYRSVRDRRPQFRARYRPVAPVELRARGTLEHWLTERYCLYTARGGSLYRAEIHHRPWPLQNAEAEIETNTMAQAAGIMLPQAVPLLHFAKRLEVLVWPLRKTNAHALLGKPLDKPG